MACGTKPKKSRVSGVPYPIIRPLANENAGFLASSYWGRLSRTLNRRDSRQAARKKSQDKENGSRPINTKQIFGTAHLPLCQVSKTWSKNPFAGVPKLRLIDPWVAVLTPVIWPYAI